MLENLINRMCSFVLFFILVGACQQGVPTERHSASSNVKDSSGDSTGADLTGSAPSGLYLVDNGCDAMIASAGSCTKSTNLQLTQGQSGTASQTQSASTQQTRNANQPVSLTPDAGLQLVSTSDTSTQDTTTVSTTAITSDPTTAPTTTTAPSSAPTTASPQAACGTDIEKQGICDPEPRTQIAINNMTTDVPYYFALPGSVVHNATKKCESIVSTGHVCKTYTTYSAFDGKSFTATTTIAACKGVSCTANSVNDMCSGCTVYSKYSPISLDTVFTYLGSGQSGGTQGVDAQSTDTQSTPQ